MFLNSLYNTPSRTYYKLISILQLTEDRRAKEPQTLSWNILEFSGATFCSATHARTAGTS